MQFDRFRMAMFRTAFVPEREETLALLDCLRFLVVDGAREKILAHPLGPAPVWREWADETFLGFSTGRIMLQSGHRFGTSEPTSGQKTKRSWGRFRPDHELRTFRKLYDWQIPAEHQELYDAHPGAYLRSAEAYLLSGCARAPRMLEIGAGNCVHVAFRHVLNPDQRTTVIDLPESIFAGYLLLRSVGIDVALPHEDRAAAVTMRLPYQEIDGSFDFAFNMASFQEMRPDVVQGYLRLARSRLAPGGRIQSVNLSISKQAGNAQLSDYGIDLSESREAPFIGTVHGIAMSVVERAPR